LTFFYTVPIGLTLTWVNYFVFFWTKGPLRDTIENRRAALAGSTALTSFKNQAKLAARKQRMVTGSSRGAPNEKN